eukprot:SAG22_NODE_11169_length_497_cov_1.025126_1_plen_122_part_01
MSRYVPRPGSGHSAVSSQAGRPQSAKPPKFVYADRNRPGSAPWLQGGREGLHRPDSAGSRDIAQNFAGVNVNGEPATVEIDGKVDANKLVDALDSLQHTDEQVVAMRRLMQLCGPSPSRDLA